MAVLHCIALLANRLVDPRSRMPPEATDMLVHLLHRVTVQSLNVQIPSIDPIEFYNIFSSDNLTICIFVLKKGAVMPVHDHPSMTVYSKIVSGDLHFKTFDFLPNSTYTTDTTTKAMGRYARVEVDRVITGGGPDSLLVIDPRKGPNLHCFTAVSDHVVMLDIIGPPYNDDDRPCTYFREISIPESYRVPDPVRTLLSSADSSVNGSMDSSMASSPVISASIGKSSKSSKKRRKKKGSIAALANKPVEEGNSVDRMRTPAESEFTSSPECTNDDCPPPRVHSPGAEAASAISAITMTTAPSTALPSPLLNSSQPPNNSPSPHHLSPSLIPSFPPPPPPISTPTTLAYLLQDDTADHGCTERMYTGQRVVPAEVERSVAARDAEIVTFAASVIALLRKIEVGSAPASPLGGGRANAEVSTGSPASQGRRAAV
ncbi:hypothetical protein BC829DRAFT_400148 [Chytridium lagenaria]|nr:hypothetical protein BC829DRAFT_400148 [Chytridium lagenaria]